MTEEQFLRYCFKLRLDAVSVLSKVAVITLQHSIQKQDVSVFEHVIGFTRAALAVSPVGHPMRAVLIPLLPTCLHSLYVLTDDITLLRESVWIFSKMCTLGSARIDVRSILNPVVRRFTLTDVPDYHLIAPFRHNITSVATETYLAALETLRSRVYEAFNRGGDLEDLTEALTGCRAALTVAPDAGLVRPGVYCDWATMLCARFRHIGNEDDIDQAIQLHREARTVLENEPAHLAICLEGLANDLDCRFSSLGCQKDIDESIVIRQSVLKDGRVGESRGHTLHNLAVGLFNRYTHGGSLDDLEDAMQAHRESQLLLPPTHPQYRTALINLAMVLGVRYRQFWLPDDLEESIELYRRLLQICKRGDPNRAIVLNNMSAALYSRFELNRTWDDIREAEMLLREAIVLRPAGHPSHPHALNNLANMLSKRFDGTGRIEDLDKAISMHREVLALRGPGHMDRSASLLNLGQVTAQRYERFGELEDLQEAVRLYRESLSLRPLDHPLRVLSVVNVAQALLERFRVLGNSEDAEESRVLHLEALQLAGTGQTDRILCLFRLARLYMDEKTVYHDLDIALQYLLDAIQDTTADPQYRLSHALRTLRRIENIDARRMELLRPQLMDVHLAIVDLMPLAASFDLDIQHRLGVLRGAQHMATEAASHALNLSQPNLAVEVLEAGRAVFWTRSLNLRPTMDNLPLALREEFQGFSHQIETDSWKFSAESVAPDEMEILTQKGVEEKEIARRRRQSVLFDSLISRIRAIPECERFLRPELFDTLAQVAEKGPVVMLVASKYSCDAIVVTASRRAERVLLPAVSPDSLRKLSEVLKGANIDSRDGGERIMNKVHPGQPGALYVLRSLWDTVVKVVLDALQIKPSIGRNRPRLWWCPTGIFTFLPVHAAGNYIDGGQCCADYVVSSYTPTLSALLNARRSLRPIPREAAKMLLAAVPCPYRGSSLPATIEEVCFVKQVVPPRLVMTMSPEDDCAVEATAGATVSTLLEKLPEATILHLASHGWQHPSDPLESGFIMRDGMLTIAKLMPLPLPNAFLAVLSACETAKGDQAQPDQTVHLAAAMMFAGYKSVIATMWSMSDVDGPDVARTVYQHLFDGEGDYLDPDVIPYALDAAVQNLRGKGLHPSRWAPYVHIGV